MKGGQVKKKISVYLFFTGFLGNLVFLLVFIYLMHAEQLSARLLLSKSIEQLNIDVPVVIKAALQPTPKNTMIPLDGVVIRQHPRILLPQMVDWNNQEGSVFFKQRISDHASNKSYLNNCGHNALMSLVVCWLSENNEQVLHTLVGEMLGYELNVPTADTTYSNGWQLALAYDLVFPVLDDTQRIIIENKITQALKATLLNLDEDAASLWHGRSTHAMIAWLCAIVLSDRIEGVVDLQRRAQAHFLSAINGLAYTAIWPGGYNYWIQNRAFLFALASSAYLNGLTGAENVDQVKRVMKQVGYWTVYATRPDNKIEGFGDEGARIDLKDETRRVIDLIVQITRDPVLAGYSKYLAKLHGVESYYRGYRWGFLLFNDPTILALGDGTLLSLAPYLSEAKLFGKKTTNYAYFHSGWGRDDTFISFKAGHVFSHHGHYDAGHFTLFKGAPLVINSSTYGGFFTFNRLNYSIRTIAKNSLLIQKPNEKVKPNRHFKINISDGGQRIIMPTGSAVLSVAEWFSNYQQGQHFEGAELIDFASNKKDGYAYISANLTPSYNSTQYDENNDSGKVSEVVRRVLYLSQEDHLIVYDKVVSTSSNYQKKWLLHSVRRPQIDGLTVLKGQADNGILESYSDEAIVRNGRGILNVKVLLPKQAKLHLVGGQDYQYYIETDSDDSVLNGTNFNHGASTALWHDVGFWRIEIMPTIPAKETQFLVIMSPSLDYQRSDKVEIINVTQTEAVGVMTEQLVVIFAPDFGSRSVDFNLTKPRYKLLIIGLSVFKSVDIRQNGRLIGQVSINNSVANYQANEPLLGKISIKW